VTSWQYFTLAGRLSWKIDVPERQVDPIRLVDMVVARLS